MIKNIAVLPGDGIGPEITEQAIKVLNAVAKRYNHTFNYTYALIGACAIDECGEPYPEESHLVCTQSDAILFGAIGDPKYDNDPKAKVRPEQGLLKMRSELGLFANIRPIELFESQLKKSPLKEEVIKDANLVIVRELTGGLYFGEPRGRSEDGSMAFDTCVYSRVEIERVARKAFEIARTRKNHLTVVDKANVLATSRLWRECVKELHLKEYADVELDFMFVDNAAMQLVTAPSFFDVLLTENLFGDILSDEASVITGSIGLLPSASIGTNCALFEPIHGSFPQAAGKNIANPLATILSAAMLIEYSFGAKEEAEKIRKACIKSIEAGICTADIAATGAISYGTSQVGDFIAESI